MGKKWTFAAALCLCLLACLAVPARAASGECGVNGAHAVWSLDGQGTLTISGEGAMASYTAVNPPWYESRELIKSLVIRPGITLIGTLAFADCPNLSSVSIPPTVREINNSAFYKCVSLTSVTLPEGVVVLEPQAFAYCTGLTDLTLPSGLTQIGGGAFRECSGLSSVTIPDTVTSIGSSAFRECSGLTGVNIPDGIKTIEKYTFYRCRKLKNVTLPDTVTSIGKWAFDGCSGFTRINIPRGVTSIKAAAFDNCDNLWTVLYAGSEAEWKEISIDVWNEPLTTARLHYNGERPVFYPVAVADAYEEPSGAGEYEAGVPVSLHAGSREGYNFGGWTILGAAADNPDAPDASFTMPAGPVEARANWRRPGDELPSVAVTGSFVSLGFTVITVDPAALNALPSTPAVFTVCLDQGGQRVTGVVQGSVSLSTGRISFRKDFSPGDRLFFLDPATLVPLAKPVVL